MPIETINVGGLTELVGAVAALNIDATPGRQYWFRGLRCHDYKLQPKIYRFGRTADEAFEREGRLLTRFRQRSQAYWKEGYPQTNWEHLFAMQHYGIPTRLLDWSENLMVAAYFASGLDVGHAHEGPCQCVVWGVDPVLWNRSTPVLAGFGDQVYVLNTVDEELEAYEPFSKRKHQKSPLAIYGSHNTGRILAQRGTFMVWGSDERELEVICGEYPLAVLYRYVVTGDKQQFAMELKKLGFTESMFFPDLVSLASEITAMEAWK